MALINITCDTPDDLFKAPEFPVLPAGRHLFVIANDLEVTQTKGDQPKDIVKLEARCQDEGEGKGIPVFDQFLLIKPEEAITEDAQTSKRINDASFAQFAVAAGLATVDDIKAGNGFDIADAKGKFFNAVTKVVLEKVYPPELDESGEPKKAHRARIKKYLFEPAK